MFFSEITCPKLPPIQAGASITPAPCATGPMRFHSACHFRCPLGFAIQQHPSLTSFDLLCQVNGRWRGSIPRCRGRPLFHPVDEDCCICRHNGPKQSCHLVYMTRPYNRRVADYIFPECILKDHKNDAIKCPKLPKLCRETNRLRFVKIWSIHNYCVDYGKMWSICFLKGKEFLKVRKIQKTLYVSKKLNSWPFFYYSVRH